jgi:hypothetical protein
MADRWPKPSVFQAETFPDIHMPWHRLPPAGRAEEMLFGLTEVA